MYVHLTPGNLQKSSWNPRTPPMEKKTASLFPLEITSKRPSVKRWIGTFPLTKAIAFKLQPAYYSVNLHTYDCSPWKAPIVCWGTVDSIFSKQGWPIWNKDRKASSNWNILNFTAPCSMLAARNIERSTLNQDRFSTRSSWCVNIKIKSSRNHKSSFLLQRPVFRWHFARDGKPQLRQFSPNFPDFIKLILLSQSLHVVWVWQGNGRQSGMQMDETQFGQAGCHARRRTAPVPRNVCLWRKCKARALQATPSLSALPREKVSWWKLGSLRRLGQDHFHWSLPTDANSSSVVEGY